MIWFSSDWHFNHTNICGPKLSQWKSGFRNFNSLKEMNDIILHNINEKVKTNDIIFFLGDFAFGNKQDIPNLRKQIYCKNIHLIFGNHDASIKKLYQSEFSSCHEYYELKDRGKIFCLFHYPIASWNHISHKNSYQPHGHCHGNYHTPHSGQIDIGVDPQNFQPISLDEYVDVSNANFLRSKVDHHMAV